MNDYIFGIINYALVGDRINLIKSIKNYSSSLKAEGNFNGANKLINLIGTNTRGEQTEVLLTEVLAELDISDKELFDPLIDLSNLIELIKDENKVQKIGPLKTFIYGRPGTGKTSLVYYLKHKTNRNLFYISSSSIVSSLLGETQKNIDKLAKDIKKVSENSIILIDEFDSLIGNRDESMNNEYKRLVGTFNMMIDFLPKNSILFVISNKPNMIDDAVVRRFNIKIQMDKIGKQNFLDYFKKEALIFEVKVKFDLIEKIIDTLGDQTEFQISYTHINIVLTDYYFFNKNIYQNLINLLNINSEIDILKEKNHFNLEEIELINK